MLQSGFQSHQKTFSKLKALLRKAAETTVESLRNAIGRPIDLITPTESVNFITTAGYEPD